MYVRRSILIHLCMYGIYVYGCVHMYVCMSVCMYLSMYGCGVVFLFVVAVVVV